MHALRFFFRNVSPLCACNRLIIYALKIFRDKTLPDGGSAVTGSDESPQRRRQAPAGSIVAIRDVSRSAVSYIESLAELIDANEGFYDRQTRSRPRKQRVIRSANVDGDAHEHWPTQTATPTYRLTLQDAHGNLCYAHEIEPLPFLRSSPDLYPVRLGSKLLVQKGATVVFGSALQLTPSTCRFLGGELPHMNHDLYRRELQNFKREINYTG
ncbi:hypothetical protein KL941_004785 [Ogataea angusta]|nr:hypothetical protein KL941_004785 [Ogataea angusta]